MKKNLRIIVLLSVTLSLQLLCAASLAPITIASGGEDFVGMAKAAPLVLPVAGQGIIEFTASAPAGSNLYRPGLIFSSTQRGDPDEGETKLVVSLGDNMDGTHVNGKDAYFIQRTKNNYGFMVQRFSSVPTKGASKFAGLPVGVVDGAQTTNFKIIIDAAVLPNILQVYAKKPTSTAYPATPLVELTNWGANQLFTVDPKGKTYIHFAGNPYCNLTYSNISITKLDVPVKPSLGKAVVIKAGEGEGKDMNASTAMTLPSAGKGVIEFIASTGIGANVYCPGVIFSITPNAEPEAGYTKLFLTLGNNMDGGHVNGKDAYLIQKTSVNYGFMLQRFSSAPAGDEKPTMDPLPVEASPRGQAVMIKVVVDATVLPNILQVYAKKPSDEAYSPMPYIQFSALGARPLFSMDPDGKTYFYFTGNPYCNMAYSNITVRGIQPADLAPSSSGPVIGVAAGDSDNFNGMSTSAPLTLPVSGKGVVEFMVSAGPDSNIYRPGIILSPTQNADLEDGVAKLIVVAGDNMDGGHVNGKEAYLTQRTGDSPSNLLQSFSIVDQGLPVEQSARGQALMMRINIDATVQPNILQVYVKKPGSAAYPAAPLFQFTDKPGVKTQLFSVKQKGKTYLYFTGSPYCNLAYSHISITTAASGSVPVVTSPVPVLTETTSSVVQATTVSKQVMVPVQATMATPAIASTLTTSSAVQAVAANTQPSTASLQESPAVPVVVSAELTSPTAQVSVVSAQPSTVPVAAADQAPIALPVSVSVVALDKNVQESVANNQASGQLSAAPIQGSAMAPIPISTVTTNSTVQTTAVSTQLSTAPAVVVDQASTVLPVSLPAAPVDQNTQAQVAKKLPTASTVNVASGTQAPVVVASLPAPMSPDSVATASPIYEIPQAAKASYITDYSI